MTDGDRVGAEPVQDRRLEPAQGSEARSFYEKLLLEYFFRKYQMRWKIQFGEKWEELQKGKETIPSIRIIGHIMLMIYWVNGK